MKKHEKIISEFFKPYFQKYTQFESIFFLIYNFDDGIYLADEDCGINNLRRDELGDEKIYDSSFKIQDAIKLLQESKVNVSTIISDLEKLVIKLQIDAYNSNPLNEIIDDVWSDESREKLKKKIAKHLSKEIPWRYVGWCQCNVNRDGSVTIDEHKKH